MQVSELNCEAHSLFIQPVFWAPLYVVTYTASDTERAWKVQSSAHSCLLLLEHSFPLLHPCLCKGYSGKMAEEVALGLLAQIWCLWLPRAAIPPGWAQGTYLLVSTTSSRRSKIRVHRTTIGWLTRKALFQVFSLAWLPLFHPEAIPYPWPMSPLCACPTLCSVPLYPSLPYLMRTPSPATDLLLTWSPWGRPLFPGEYQSQVRSVMGMTVHTQTWVCLGMDTACGRLTCCSVLCWRSAASSLN